MKKVLFGAMLAVGFACNALAQQYPSRPVKIIVPFPPGGMDVLVRAVANELSVKWGQPVIIENRPGAGTLIGAQEAARAPSDGYTLLATIDSTLVANRFLYKSLPYDPISSFSPISLMVQSDHLILANPKLPAKDLRELVALAKQKPGTINFASFAKGSQADLVYATLNRREGIDLLQVPYKGVAPALTATMGGEVQLTTAGLSVAGGMLSGGRLKALAIAGSQRNPQFPDVPTAAEQGFPYVVASVWYGLFAPARTPAAIVEKINADVTAILKTPEFTAKQVQQRGLMLVAGGPQELTTRIRDDVAMTAEMVRNAGVTPD
jgi:tripartite-type tricarboxylate transporter receptor subunit TctC